MSSDEEWSSIFDIETGASQDVVQVLSRARLFDTLTEGQLLKLARGRRPTGRSRSRSLYHSERIRRCYPPRHEKRGYRIGDARRGSDVRRNFTG